MIEWFTINNLKANPEKFQAIMFDKSRCHVHNVLKIKSKTIEISEVVKLLGVYTDRNLDFNFHISDLCTKAGRNVNVLCRVSKNLDQKSKIYDSFIFSYFTLLSMEIL